MPNRENTRAASAFAMSAKAAAKRLEVHRRVVLAAKAAGCPAFRDNGRVHVEQLREWLADNPDVAAGGEEDALVDGLSLANLRLRNDKLAAEIDALRQQWVPVDTLKQWTDEFRTDMQRIVGRLHTVADRVIGLAPAEAETILRGVEDGIMKRLHALGTEPQPT